MAEFEFTFIKASTGRTNKGKRKGYDEAEVRELLQREGIEPLSLRRLPGDAASDRQLEYLKDLGVSYAGDLTMDEASSLITNATRRRHPADIQTRLVADAMRVEYNQYSSKREIFFKILFAVKQRGAIHLAAWYAYRVYRNNYDRKKQGISDVDSLIFQTIATEIVSQKTLLASLNRAATTTATDFRWFGAFTDEEGYERSGDSKTTAVYKYVRDRLIDEALIPSIQPKFVPTAAVSQNPVTQVSGWSFQPEKPRKSNRLIMFVGACLAAALMFKWLF